MVALAILAACGGAAEPPPTPAPEPTPSLREIQAERERLACDRLTRNVMSRNSDPTKARVVYAECVGYSHREGVVLVEMLHAYETAAVRSQYGQPDRYLPTYRCLVPVEFYDDRLFVNTDGAQCEEEWWR